MGIGATASFSQRLLAWWDEHGRKDLPWQQPRSPYGVWISEIMLQQTQVATVIPYFHRWMERFPDIASLAAAPLDAVLSRWSGLGYYARARNLHAAAIRCVQEHGGKLPLDAPSLTALPGIGPSTANAIISQATDRPAALLDGNVRRVLARHAAVPGWTDAAATQRKLWAEAEARLPKERGADYTQAIMDLGALVCTRSRPACSACPVAEDCQALAQGRVAEFPAPRPPARVSDKILHMLILRDEAGRVLLEKRPPAGVWGGLWCLPEGESLSAIEERLGVSASQAVDLPPVRHRLSHLRMEIRPALAPRPNGNSVQCSPEQGWFDAAAQSSLGLPRPVSELLKQLNDGELT